MEHSLRPNTLGGNTVFGVAGARGHRYDAKLSSIYRVSLIRYCRVMWKKTLEAYYHTGGLVSVGAVGAAGPTDFLFLFIQKFLYAII